MMNLNSCSVVLISVLCLFIVEQTFALENPVKFYLYTPSNTETAIELNRLTDYKNILNTNLELKIVIHGFFESANRYWMRDIKNAYLKKGDYNVILVDWSFWAIWRPILAIANVPTVGLAISNVITYLVSNGLALEKVHIVSFSLSTHAAGFAGQYVHAKFGKKIGRITGLDSVAKSFEDKPDNERLSKDDADFVDAIYTSWVGLRDPYGTVNFYVNGPILQPGCPDIYVDGENTSLLDKLINRFLCSHERSHSYFIESISCDGFLAVRCSNRALFSLGMCANNIRAVFGENVPAGVPAGSYFLTTNSQSPFHTEQC